MVSGAKGIYRFGEFELDPGEHRLLRGTEEIYLPPKTFETLQHLVSRHGHIVRKDELLDTLWSGVFVTENALAQCIKEVREALNDDAHQPRYVKTIPRVGYKFIADVEEVFRPILDKGLSQPATTSLPESKRSDQRSLQTDECASASAVQPANSIFRSRLLRLAVVAIAAGALIGAAYYLSKREVAPPQRITSIAVLPFRPINSEARDESLELGMADTLITTLSNVGEITVRPTSAVRKYTALDQDALAAGREQAVDAVLEGSIQKVDDRIRVTVRLLRVSDGAQIWTDSIDQKAGDIFAIQDSISERIASTLAPKFSGEEKELLTKRYTTNTEAYRFYLKGRYFLNKGTGGDFRQSIEYFQQALEQDPNYALAYVGLADSYAQLGSFGLAPTSDSYGKARAASLRALELDDKLAEAHASLAFILTNYYWDWGEAEKQFREAIKLNPNYAMSHNWYSQYLAFMGRPEEAIAEAKRGQEIDPLSPWNNSGFILFLARRYDEASEASQKALELDPNFAVAHMAKGLSFVQLKKYSQGISELQRATANPDSRALLAYAYALSGDKVEARKIMNELDQLSQEQYVSPFPLAIGYVGLGDHDRAFAELEKAYAERSWAMGMLRVNPVFDPIRSDKRFAVLLQRVNLS